MSVSVNRPASLTPMPAGGSSRGDQGGLVVVFLVLLFATFLFSANSSSGQRGAVAGVIAMLLFPLAWFSPRAGLPAMVIYLMVMGGFRRFLIPILGYTELDPLLIVGPAVATICFINFVINRQIKPTTQIGKWVIGLMACMGLAIFNPLQGNPLVGLTGAAFYLVPLMWYCVGRNFGTVQTIKTLANLVLITSIFGAVYGLKQHFFGFTDAELQWFRLAAFSNAVGGTERTMSFYTSPAEYANFLAIGIAICFSYFLKGKKIFILLILFLAYAMLLTGIRGVFFVSAGACMVMWAVQGRDQRAWVPRVVLAVFIVGLGGFFSLQQLGGAAKSVGGGDTGAEMVNHQIEGLTDPLGKNSTAQNHLGLIGIGIIEGIKMPVGYGLGATTLGVGHFGGAGATTFNAENDVASIFYSLGLIGGIFLIGSIVVTFRAAFMYWAQTRTAAPLVVLGILVSSYGNWLTAGNYAQSVFVWVLVGCLDRCWRDGRAVPGFTSPTKGDLGAIAIWKRTLSRRLRGVSPSWEASYRRAGKGKVKPALDTEDSASRRASTNSMVQRLTPSAARALERARSAAENNLPGEAQVEG